MRENTDQKKSEYKHFSRSVYKLADLGFGILIIFIISQLVDFVSC